MSPARNALRHYVENRLKEVLSDFAQHVQIGADIQGVGSPAKLAEHIGIGVQSIKKLFDFTWQPSLRAMVEFCTALGLRLTLEVVAESRLLSNPRPRRLPQDPIKLETIDSNTRAVFREWQLQIWDRANTLDLTPGLVKKRLGSTFADALALLDVNESARTNIQTAWRLTHLIAATTACEASLIFRFEGPFDTWQSWGMRRGWKPVGIKKYHRTPDQRIYPTASGPPRLVDVPDPELQDWAYDQPWYEYEPYLATGDFKKAQKRIGVIREAMRGRRLVDEPSLPVPSSVPTFLKDLPTALKTPKRQMKKGVLIGGEPGHSHLLLAKEVMRRHGIEPVWHIPADRVSTATLPISADVIVVYGKFIGHDLQRAIRSQARPDQKFIRLGVQSGTWAEEFEKAGFRK